MLSDCTCPIHLHCSLRGGWNEHAEPDKGLHNHQGCEPVGRQAAQPAQLSQSEPKIEVAAKVLAARRPLTLLQQRHVETTVEAGSSSLMEDKLLVDPAPDFISALATALGKQPAAIEHVAAGPRKPHSGRTAASSTSPRSTLSQQRFTLSRVRMFRKQSVPVCLKGWILQE